MHGLVELPLRFLAEMCGYCVPANRDRTTKAAMGPDCQVYLLYCLDGRGLRFILIFGLTRENLNA